MEISPEWILAVLISLGGVIASLAGIIYSSLSRRLAIQDQIIARLQDDIDRLAQGCGISQCLWKR
jgi:hypothetical protein